MFLYKNKFIYIDKVNKVNKMKKNSASYYFKEANKKAESFSLFFKKQNREDAIELYRKAANLYKMEELYINAMNCYEKSAKLNLLLDNKFEASLDYLEAGRMAKILRCDKIEYYYKKHIELNDITSIGKIYKELADFYRINNSNEGALKYYQMAYDCFKKKKRKNMMIECLEYLSIININLKHYYIASANLIAVSDNINYDHHKYITNAILLALYDDLINSKDFINSKDLYRMYKNKLNYEQIDLIDKLIDYFENKNFALKDGLLDLLNKKEMQFMINKDHMIIIELIKKYIISS